MVLLKNKEKHINYYNTTLKSRRPKDRMDDDDTEDNSAMQSCLGSFKKESRANHNRYYLDEPIGVSSKYRLLIQNLIEASEGDVVELWINSPGGDLGSCLSIIAAIKETPAQVIGVLLGSGYSAAGAIFLSCDSQAVLDSSSLMVHTATMGSFGKMNDLSSYLEFSKTQVNSFIDSTYLNFLTPAEIESVKNGKEIWLGTAEVRERLDNRQKIQTEAFELEQKKAQEAIEAEIASREAKAKGKAVKIGAAKGKASSKAKPKAKGK